MFIDGRICEDDCSAHHEVKEVLLVLRTCTRDPMFMQAFKPLGRRRQGLDLQGCSKGKNAPHRGYR